MLWAFVLPVPEYIYIAVRDDVAAETIAPNVMVVGNPIPPSPVTVRVLVNVPALEN